MKVLWTAFVFLAVLFVGCREVPVPSEVLQAEGQEQELWRAGASLYFGPEYDLYLESLKEARAKVAKEGLRLGWFRNYDPVREDFLAVLVAGERILGQLEAFKRETTGSLDRASQAVRERIESLDKITLSLGERGQGRQEIVQAGIFLREAESFIRRGEFETAREKILGAGDALRKAEDAVLSHIRRYLDEDQVRTWKRWADETVAESRKKGGLAIIVSKLERKLTVYRNGQPLRSYDVGLGINGLLTKTMSGDNATPEGRYRVIGKNPRSQYHKALLINYPNEEDRKRFSVAQREGRVPKGASLGGDIEIHGSGQDILTRGCVSMDNDEMDELFELVGLGTPVTIVGTTEVENFVIKALGKGRTGA